MSYFKKRIELYQRNSDLSWATTPSCMLEDAYNLSIQMGMGNIKDTAGFELINAGGKYFDGTILDGFRLADNIKIYFAKDREVNTATDLVFDGMLTDQPQKIGDKGRNISIKCKSRTEFFFESLIMIDRQSASPPTIVKEIVDAVNIRNINNPKFQINYDYGSSIVTSKSNGTTFTNLPQFSGFYEQANLLLEKVSSYENTKDPNGSYIYYVDKNNVFHWTYRGLTPSSFTITEGTEPKDIKIDYSKEDVVNGLIIQVGRSPNGYGNTVYVQDDVSVTKNGVKQKYITTTADIAPTLMANEKLYNSTKFDKDSGDYPTAAALSAGYTTYWKSTLTDNQNAPTCTAGNSVSNITDKDLYNYAVEREAKWKGQLYGYLLLAKLANPRYKVDVTLSRVTDWNIGDLITVNIPSHGLVDKKLRCVGITYTDTTTELELVEDPQRS